MALKPVTVPASEEKVYDLPRVSQLQISQSGYGESLICHAQIDFARALTPTTFEDAPPKSGVGISVKISIAALRNDHPDVYAAMDVINTFAVQKALEQGALSEA